MQAMSRKKPASKDKAAVPEESDALALRDAEIKQLRQEIESLKDELQWERDIGMSARKTAAEAVAQVEGLRAAARDAQKRHETELLILEDEWKTKSDEMQHRIQVRLILNFFDLPSAVAVQSQRRCVSPVPFACSIDIRSTNLRI